MKRTLAWIIGLASVIVLSPSLKAADHIDSPTLTTDPSTDITDVYAWMQDDDPENPLSDTRYVNLVMDVSHDAAPTAAFSTVAQYVFHVTKHPGYGAPPAGEQLILCTFAPNGRGQCWVGPAAGGPPVDYVGDIAPDNEAGTTSFSNRVKVFVGRRNDPFFFNLAGFSAVTAAVRMAAAGGLTLNPQGCPQLDAATAGYLRSQLGHAPYMPPATPPPAVDFFEGNAILSIVVQIDKVLISDPANPVIGVWASTNMPE